MRKSSKKTIVFVVGCQRSGTSIMLKTFKKDLYAKVYEDEYSKLTTYDKKDHIRLNPLPVLKKTIEKDNASLIITKPLVETQYADKILDYFENSFAIWMYRDYKDVAFSNVSHFGLRNGVNNLRPIVENQKNNWRSENLPEKVRKIVLKHFSEDMNPYDAAALFWYVRNYFYFYLELDKRDDVIICKYEDFVQNPRKNIIRIYKFFNLQLPQENIIDEVHPHAQNKGKSINLSENVDKLCCELQKELEVKEINPL